MFRVDDSSDGGPLSPAARDQALGKPESKLHRRNDTELHHQARSVRMPAELDDLASATLRAFFYHQKSETLILMLTNRTSTTTDIHSLSIEAIPEEATMHTGLELVLRRGV